MTVYTFFGADRYNITRGDAADSAKSWPNATTVAKARRPRQGRSPRWH